MGPHCHHSGKLTSSEAELVPLAILCIRRASIVCSVASHLHKAFECQCTCQNYNSMRAEKYNGAHLDPIIFSGSIPVSSGGTRQHDGGTCMQTPALFFLPRLPFLLSPFQGEGVLSWLPVTQPSASHHTPAMVMCLMVQLLGTEKPIVHQHLQLTHWLLTRRDAQIMGQCKEYRNSYM